MACRSRLCLDYFNANRRVNPSNILLPLLFFDSDLDRGIGFRKYLRNVHNIKAACISAYCVAAKKIR